MNKVFPSIMDWFTESKVDKREYLVFLRVSISLVALLDLLTVNTGFRLFYGLENTILPLETSYVLSSYFYILDGFYGFLQTYALYDLFIVYAPYVYAFSLLSLGFGFLSRYMAFVAVVLHFIIFKSFDLYNYGLDTFTGIALFYCFVFPVGQNNSIDALIFKNRRRSDFNYARILQVHLCIIYLFAGLPKMLAATWWDGIAIWRAMTNVYSSVDNLPYILFVAAGIATILLEVSYPILVWFKKSRVIIVVLMIALHINIAVIMNLYVFACVMIALNISAWYEYLPLDKKNKYE